MLNVELNHAVLDFIEANPERWDQTNYGNAYSGTNCYLGLGIRLSDNPNPNDGYWFDTGMEVLGLTDKQASQISYTECTNNDFSFDLTVDNIRQFVSDVTGHDFTKK